jgi:hypothetical protein
MSGMIAGTPKGKDVNVSRRGFGEAIAVLVLEHSSS